MAILGKPGHKFTRMASIEYPIRVRRIPNESAVKYSRDMSDTTVADEASKMLAAGERMGITKGAATLLTEALTITP